MSLNLTEIFFKDYKTGILSRRNYCLINFFLFAFGLILAFFYKSIADVPLEEITSQTSYKILAIVSFYFTFVILMKRLRDIGIRYLTANMTLILLFYFLPFTFFVFISADDLSNIILNNMNIISDMPFMTITLFCVIASVWLYLGYLILIPYFLPSQYCQKGDLSIKEHIDQKMEMKQLHNILFWDIAKGSIDRTTYFLSCLLPTLFISTLYMIAMATLFQSGDFDRDNVPAFPIILLNCTALFVALKIYSVYILTIKRFRNMGIKNPFRLTFMLYFAMPVVIGIILGLYLLLSKGQEIKSIMPLILMLGYFLIYIGAEIMLYFFKPGFFNRSNE